MRDLPLVAPLGADGDRASDAFGQGFIAIMTTGDPRSDEQLAEDYLAGDIDAFGRIVERYHDDLMRFLRRLMGDPASADDVFQDTFLQVHESLSTFDTSRRLKPWLFTVAANKGRDALRKRKRRRAMSLDAEIGGDDGAKFVDLLEIDLPGPDTRLDDEERSKMVQRAIETLSPKLREVLLLAYFQRLSYQQIADMFDIPLGTVKSRLHSAVAGFGQAWQVQVEKAKADGVWASENRGHGNGT
jgi:RNA polymerase sigma-70 factor (ECF subfamily)